MDPLSVCASTLAVLGAAFQCSKALCKIFGSVMHAETDTSHHFHLLQSVVDTLARMQTFAMHSTQFQLPEALSRRIEDWTLDAEQVLARLEEASPGKAASSLQKHWRMIKWGLRPNQWLHKFFHRLHLYYLDLIVNLNLCQVDNQLHMHRMLSDIVSKKSRDEVAAAETAVILTPKFVVRGPGEGSRRVDFFATQYKKDIHTGFPSQKTHMFFSSWLTVALLTKLQLHTSSSHKADTKESLGDTCLVFEITVSASIIRWLRLQLYLPLAYSGSTLSHPRLSFARIVPKSAPIIQAIYQGDTLTADALFRTRQASPSDILIDGSTLLHIAARQGDISTVRYLIGRNVSLDSVDQDLDTALHIATATQQPYDLLRLLVDAGCEPVTTNRSGKTCFHQLSNEPVRQLLATTSDPVDPYLQDGEGMTVMHYLSYSKSTQPEYVRTLLQDNLSCLAVRDCLGRSPVDLAAVRGNTSLVSHYLALEGVASSCLAGDNLLRLLHMAARSKRREVYGVIIKKYTEIALRDSHGWSDLHTAVADRDEEAIQRILVTEGTRSWNEKDRHGVTPLDLEGRLTGKIPAEADSSIDCCPTRAAEPRYLDVYRLYLYSLKESILPKIVIGAVLFGFWVWAYSCLWY